MEGDGAGQELLTRFEVAALLGVAPKTVSRWVYEKRLPFVPSADGGRERRYRRDVVERFDPPRPRLSTDTRQSVATYQAAVVQEKTEAQRKVERAARWAEESGQAAAPTERRAPWDSELAHLVDRFVNERLRQRAIGPTTAKGYRKGLQRTVREMKALVPSHLTRRRIETWVGRSELATTTLRLRLSQLKTFCGWLVERDTLRRDPTIGMARIPRPRLLPRALTPKEVQRLLAQAPNARARLIIVLIAQQGLRIGEVSALEVGDVDWRAEVLTVRGKGGHERVLPLMAETRDAIEAYLDERPAAAGPLIRSERELHAPMSAATLSRYMRRWLIRAGIKKRPNDGKSAHAIRHTFAQELADRGASPFQLRDALGHANVATVQIYIRRNVPGLRDVMDGRRYGARR